MVLNNQDNIPSTLIAKNTSKETIKKWTPTREGPPQIPDPPGGLERGHHRSGLILKASSTQLLKEAFGEVEKAEPCSAASSHIHIHRTHKPPAIIAHVSSGPHVSFTNEGLDHMICKITLWPLVGLAQ